MLKYNNFEEKSQQQKYPVCTLEQYVFCPPGYTLILNIPAWNDGTETLCKLVTPTTNIQIYPQVLTVLRQEVKTSTFFDQ